MDLRNIGTRKMARRPAQVPTRLEIPDAQIERATYVGSAEHKAARWWGGLPQARVDASGNASRPKKQKTTICPLITAQERELATKWVQHALRRKQYRFHEGDKDFPKHIWYNCDGQVWFGYCINGVAGQYKGWPIGEDELRAIFD